MVIREVRSIDVVYLNGGTRARATSRLDCGHELVVETAFVGVGADTFVASVRVATVGTLRACRECVELAPPDAPPPFQVPGAPAAPPPTPEHVKIKTRPL